MQKIEVSIIILRHYYPFSGTVNSNFQNHTIKPEIILSVILIMRILLLLCLILALVKCEVFDDIYLYGRSQPTNWYGVQAPPPGYFPGGVYNALSLTPYGPFPYPRY